MGLYLSIVAILFCFGNHMCPAVQYSDRIHKEAGKGSSWTLNN